MKMDFDPEAELTAMLAKYRVPKKVRERFIFPWWGCCSFKDLCIFAHNMGDPDGYDWTKSWDAQDGWLNTFYGAVAQSMARVEMILHDSGADAGYGPPIFYDPGGGTGTGPPPPPKFPPP
jgi:hypothetical protein